MGLMPHLHTHVRNRMLQKPTRAPELPATSESVAPSQSMTDTIAAFAPSAMFWTREDVAKALKISKPTVYRMVERGDLAVYRVCRRLRFLRTDVLAYVAKRRTAARDHDQYAGPKD